MALVLRNLKKQTRNTSIIYSDFLNSFNIDSVKKDIIQLENEDSVKQSIKNLLLTNRGDRFFNPTLGSDIKYSLFENYTSATEQILSDLVKTCIKNFEPRVNVIDVKVLGSPDNNSINLSLIFSVINKSEPITLELTLNRVR